MTQRTKLPLLPLRGLSLFPKMVIHFDVERKKSKSAVHAAMERNGQILLFCQSDITAEFPKKKDLYNVGALAEVKQILSLPDGNIRVLVEGISRACIVRYYGDEKCDFASYKVPEEVPPCDELYGKALSGRALHLFEEYISNYTNAESDTLAFIDELSDCGEIADMVASNFPLSSAQRQEILAETDIAKRLEALLAMMEEKLRVLEVEESIASKLAGRIHENQRDYVIREQMRVLQGELDGGENAEAEKYRAEINSRKLPECVKDKLLDEVGKMEKQPSMSQEYALIQTYIETVLALPWDKEDEEILDIASAKKILDRDHFGLDKVKERILEYIAVKKLGGDGGSRVLCLIGPPGTGKTSIAKSLAEALGRKYVRISLGGIQSEAEIRGHRKTYIGAMPGRIMEAYKTAGTSNPLILFDEIDKMASDYKGDPASAMLEVLDTEQNKAFRDHYAELPFDLSKTLFVMTANSYSGIPFPLLDRMDVIDISGYTDDEKLQIAKRYLLPKQMKRSGLDRKMMNISDAVLREIIEGYTKESGVRNLERHIGTVCRKAAFDIVSSENGADNANNENNADNKNKGTRDGIADTKSKAENKVTVNKVIVNKAVLKKYLGARIFMTPETETKNAVGKVTGLAWTNHGGETMPIEACFMDGNGKITLTGSLGDVMKESAQAAVSLVRKKSEKYGIDKDFYKKYDIHIHVPEGAVPKDGPSAGVTMVTALVSALSGKEVQKHLAMTGEITLLGSVIPIGGLKEKTLAAFREGVKTVIIPYENKKDYDELPKKIKDGMKFIFAKDIDAVLKEALKQR